MADENTENMVPESAALEGRAQESATLDATGLLCPLPVLKARKRLAGLAPGACLEMLCDDPAAVVDVPHFCREAGHVLEREEQLGNGKLRFEIRKGGKR